MNKTRLRVYYPKAVPILTPREMANTSTAADHQCHCLAEWINLTFLPPSQHGVIANDLDARIPQLKRLMYKLILVIRKLYPKFEIEKPKSDGWVPTVFAKVKETSLTSEMWVYVIAFNDRWSSAKKRSIVWNQFVKELGYVNEIPRPETCGKLKVNSCDLTNCG